LIPGFFKALFWATRLIPRVEFSFLISPIMRLFPFAPFGCLSFSTLPSGRPADLVFLVRSDLVGSPPGCFFEVPLPLRPPAPLPLRYYERNPLASLVSVKFPLSLFPFCLFSFLPWPLGPPSLLHWRAFRFSLELPCVFSFANFGFGSLD